MQWKKKICLGVALCVIGFLMLGMNGGPKSSLECADVRAPRPLPAKVVSLVRTESPPRVADQQPEGVACSCQTCVADTGLSEWFDKRYDPLQQPYLTAQNHSLSQDALKWWLRLQGSPQQPTLEEVIQEMFKVVSSPPEDWLPQPDRCRTCAVVGNSPNLLSSKFGPLIDSHATVIRLNKAITAGYEGDVGNKTTHRIIYPESAIDIKPGVHLVLLPFKVRDLQWLISALTTGEIKTTYMRVKERVKADKDKVMVVHPALFKYTADKWTEHHGRYPSTGILAIILALHMCDEVSVFGYGADSQGNWHHYWQKQQGMSAFRKTGVHNGEFEAEVIKRLAADGKIKLQRR